MSKIKTELPPFTNENAKTLKFQKPTDEEGSNEERKIMSHK